MITVKELLMIASGVSSIGIYDIDDTFIETVDICSIMGYLNHFVRHFQVVTETRSNDIRMNIYLGE